NGRNNWFAEPEARRPHWPAWNRAAVLGKLQRGRAGRVAGCKFFQIDAGAERSAFAPKDGDVGSVVAIERQKGLIQGFSMLGIDGLKRRGTRMNDRKNAIMPFNANWHGYLLLARLGRAACNHPF